MKNIKKEKHFNNVSDFPFLIIECENNVSMPDLIKVEKHYHEEFEIGYFFKGDAIYEIDGIPYKIDGEHITFTKQNAVHSSHIYNTKHLDLTVFLFNLSILEGNVNDYCSNSYITPLIKNLVEIPYFISNTHPNFEELKEILLKLRDINREKYQFFELDIKSLLTQFFSLLYKSNIIKRTEKNKISKKIDIATQYIHDNYKKNISRHDILILLKISDSQLTKLFKSNFNLTFTEYLNNYRLIQSALLLNSTNLSITEICFECGFNDLTYYSRIFKKRYSITPSKYRIMNELNY